MKNIIGQACYMVIALLVILLAGEYFIPEDCHVLQDGNNFVFKLLMISTAIAMKTNLSVRDVDLIMIEVKIKKMILLLNYEAYLIPPLHGTR